MTLETAEGVTMTPAIEEARRSYAIGSSNDRGAIFTRGEVVEFILDLVGYTPEANLANTRLLEPSAGHGDFLLPAIDRLMHSYLQQGGSAGRSVADLSNSVRAFEVHSESAATMRTKVAEALAPFGLKRPDAEKLACAWVMEGDFLLAPLSGEFTHIVGNPPYVRQELIPEALLLEYRARYKTLYDRADIYVPFFERCLGALAPRGRLGFICTDRWMKNKYGGPLRELIARSFALTHFVDLVDTPAFLSEVMTYPAVTVIERPVGKKRPPTKVAYRPSLDAKNLRKLATAMAAKKAPKASGVTTIEVVARGGEPWVLHDPDRLALVRRLEASCPTLEDAGCKVGIGVATGADSIFIQDYQSLDVEPSRKVPLVRTSDIQGGTVIWRGMGVLNPFKDDGGVVDLEKYPRFARYIETHRDAIEARNVAKKNKAGWFRTIDRIYPALTKAQKLLIPDIKGDAHVVYEDGNLYPHHNLYFITSDTWDLRALQAVLMSGIARLFVATYSTEMRGGYLRFQAQYLRRIRVPSWESVPGEVRDGLRDAGVRGDREAANQLTAELYGLSQAEQAIVRAT